MRKVYIAIAAIIAFSTGMLISAMLPTTEQAAFPCHIQDGSQVYDGDTIQDIRVALVETNYKRSGEVFPGVVVDAGTVYAVVDLRIAGIDAPEKHPRTKHRDGTPRTEQSRLAERAAAEKARLAIVSLLEANDWRFYLINPRLGKYAGRVVGKCLIGDVDVSQYLLHRRLAVPYDGGTKQDYKE